MGVDAVNVLKLQNVWPLTIVLGWDWALIYVHMCIRLGWHRSKLVYYHIGTLKLQKDS